MVHFGRRLIAVIALIVLHCSALVQIKSPPRFIKQPLVDELHFQVAEPHEHDKPFSIECAANGEPLPSYHWIKDGKPFDWQNYRDRVSQTPGVGTLVFQKPATEDAGRYQCFAENEHGIATFNSVSIRESNSQSSVDEEPDVLNVTDQITLAVPGGDVELHCIQGDTPMSQVEWLKNDTHLLQNDRIFINDHGNSVLIKNWTFVDEGIYACRVLNSTSVESHWMRLQLTTVPYLTDEPRITLPPSETMTVAGGTIRMTCRVSGAPKPLVKWLQYDEELAGSRYKFLDSGDLEISNVHFTDMGLYTCYANNTIGSVEASAILSVRQPTRIVDPPASYEAKSGTSVTFRCVAVADASSSLTIEWKRNGESIVFDSEPRYAVTTDNSLTISRTTGLDSGNYTCLARTELDEDASSAILIVQDIPNPPRIVTIECTDEVSIEWAPMGDNGAPIFGYTIQRSTSFTPDLWETIANDIPPTRQTHKIPITPHTNSTFRVIARNKIGLSLPSQQTKTCINQQKDLPARNPYNVQGRGTNPSNMVISWEAMPQIEHNAPGFMYRVFYRRDRTEEDWTVVDIHDWTTHSLEVQNQSTFQRYQIKVVALNEVGESRISPNVYIGYSGENVPLQAPGNFTLLEVIGSSRASFSWEMVPEDSVRGFVAGYKIQTWLDGESDEKVQETRTSGNSSTAVVSGLIPNNLYHARVFVYNSMYNGPPSEILTFRTPEDVPGPVETFSAYPEGCCTLNLAWRKPASPNIILTGYDIYYQVVEGVELGPLRQMIPSIRNPDATTATLSGLQPQTKYRVHISAVNNVGEGRRYMLEEQTLGSNSESSESVEYD